MTEHTPEEGQNVNLVTGKKTYKYQENDPEYRGRKAEENLRHGIIEERSCTDMLFCLLFIGCWVGMCIVASYAYGKGDYRRIASPYDSFGNQCGMGSAKNFPYLYYTDPTDLTTLEPETVCVRKCPKADGQPISGSNFFNSTAHPSRKTHTTRLYVTLCMPSVKSSLDKLFQKVGIMDVQKYFNDLEVSWAVLLSSLFIAFAMSFLMLNLLKYCIKVLIYLQILAVLVLLVLGTAFGIKKYQDYSNDATKQNEKYYWLSGGIVLGIFTLLYLVMFCCFQKKIRLCVEIMNQAAEFINDVCSIVLLPIGFFVYACLFLTFWMSVTLYVYTEGQQHRGSSSWWPYGTMEWDVGVKRQLGFMIFALIWNVECITATFFFITSCACAKWYFSENLEKSKQVHNPIRRSMWKAFRYHFGTIALGSLVLTVVWVIRIIAEMIHEHMKDKLDKEGNCMIEFCCKCCQCYLDCFQRFIRFLNQKAYIMCAITGKSFCTSAHDGFYTAMRNPIRFAALNYIGNVFVFIGQAFIIGLTVFICYLIFENTEYYEENLFSNILPLVFVGVFSYLVSSIFMGIHGIAADTILFCFCLDEEIHASSGQGPKFSPPQLHEFFRNNNM